MGRFLKGAAIVLVSFVVIFTGFRYYRNLKQKDIPLLQAIPPESEIIVKINKLPRMRRELLKEAAYWNQLKTIEPFETLDKDWGRWDSLLHNFPLIEKNLTAAPCVLSLLKVDTGTYATLFLIPSPAIDAGSAWKEVLRSVNAAPATLAEKYRDFSVYRLSHRCNVYYCRVPGILILSKELAAIHRSVDQIYQNNSLDKEPLFHELSLTEGKKTDINIYLNYLSLPSLVKELVKPVVSGKVSRISKWLELDLQLKDDEMLMTGFSAQPDSLSYFLNIFKQEPQRIRIPEILPYDISFMLDFGVEDFRTTYDRYLSFLEHMHAKEKLLKGHARLERKYHIDIRKDLFSWIGNEIALAYNGKSASDDNYYLVIRAKDISLAQNKLAVVAEKMTPAGEEPVMSMYKDYIIKRLAEPSLLETLFGSPFSKIHNNYFTFLKDYVIFANSPMQLEDLLNTFYLKKTLSANYNYQYFSDNIFESSNIYLYCNIRNAYPLLIDIFKGDLYNYFEKNELLFRNFEGLGIQFSYSEHLFFTNLYLKYNPSYQEVKLNNWEYDLEDVATGKPQIIQNHRTGRRNIIVFDRSNNMYLINHLGQLQWKIKLPEKPVGDITMIDYYGNAKWQYLFNSEDYIFLIDLEGNEVAGFPVSLDVSATSPVCVLDYDNTHNYRLLLALSDQKIYNYSREGKKIEGWHKVQTKGVVKAPIQYFAVKGKDYIIAYDTVGRTYVVNRRGDSRIPVNADFVKSKNNIYYENITNSRKGLFLTTDEKGKLSYVGKSGKVTYSSFGEFSPGHYFIYGDINDDKDPDFIYFDKDRMIAFDRYKKKICSHTFPEDISQAPLLFNIGRKAYLGVLLDSLQEVRFYDGGQRAFDYITFAAKQGFVVTQLENNGKHNIITTADKKVYNYRLD